MSSVFPHETAGKRGLEISTRILQQDTTWLTFESEWSGGGASGSKTPTITKVFMPALFHLTFASQMEVCTCADAERRALHDLDAIYAPLKSISAYVPGPRVYDVMLDRTCISVTMERDEPEQSVEPKCVEVRSADAHSLTWPPSAHMQ